MKNLNRDQLREKGCLANDLDGKQSALTEAITTYNSIIEEAFETVQTALDAYNETLTKARTFAQEIVEVQQAYIDDRSGKWSDSEIGLSFQEWLDEWETWAFDDDALEIEPPEEIEMPDFDLIEVFAELPESRE